MPAAADELLITARISGKPTDIDGISVFRVKPGTAGLTVNSYRTIDGQMAGDIELKGVTVAASALIGTAGKAFAAD